MHKTIKFIPLWWQIIYYQRYFLRILQIVYRLNSLFTDNVLIKSELIKNVKRVNEQKL